MKSTTTPNHGRDQRTHWEEEDEVHSHSKPMEKTQGHHRKKTEVHNHSKPMEMTQGHHRKKTEVHNHSKPMEKTQGHVRTKVRNLQIYRTGYCTVLYCKLLTFLFEQLEKKQDHFCILNPIQGVHLYHQKA